MHVAGAPSGIRYQDSILQHHVILHIHQRFNSQSVRISHREFSGVFNHMCYSGVSTAPQSPDITLAGLFAGFKLNRTCMRCTRSVCVHHLGYFRNFSRHCSMSGRTFHSVLCNVGLLLSGLMVVITNIDISPTPMSHICLCKCYRWIQSCTE